jgi:ABC-2 type transport system permease protein
VLAFNSSAELHLREANLWATAAAYLGLGLLSATLGVAVGALTGRRVYATSAGAGIAVLGYVLNAIGSQSKNLDVLRDLSPYGWAYHHTPLASGVDWGGLGLLYGFSALFVVAAVVGLRSRDITG